MQKKISIIMPVYADEYNCLKNIEYIIEQKYSNIELIIVLCNVNYSIAAKCFEYSTTDLRIKVIEKTTYSFDEVDMGIAASSGDYIIILRANDKLSDESIGIVSDYINSFDFDVFFLMESIGSYDLKAGNGDCEKFVLGRDKEIGNLWIDLYLQGFLNHQHAFYKRDIIRDIRFRPDVYNFKCDLAETLVRSAKVIAYNSKCQYIVNAYADDFHDDLISIIVPVYNSEKYIKRCMDSLINQSYKNLEIILLVKDSEDNSSEICNEYASLDSRVQIFNQVKDDLGIVRNQGLALANGRYVYMCDADDYLELNAIESVYDYAKATDADVVEFEFNALSDDEQLIHAGRFVMLSKMLGHEMRERYGDVSVWRYFAKKSVFEDNNIRFSRVLPGEDLAIYSLLFTLSRHTRQYEGVLYNYCIHGDSITTSKRRSLDSIKDTIRRVPATVIDDFKMRDLYEDHRNILATQLENHMVTAIRKNVGSDEEYRNVITEWKNFFDAYAEIRKSTFRGNAIIVGREGLFDLNNAVFLGGVHYYDDVKQALSIDKTNTSKKASETIVIFDLLNEYKSFLNSNDDLDKLLSSILAYIDDFISELRKSADSFRLVFIEDFLSGKSVTDGALIGVDNIDDVNIINEILVILYDLIEERYEEGIFIQIPIFLRFSMDGIVDSINVYKQFWLKSRLSDSLRIWNDKAEDDNNDLKKYERDKRKYITQSRGYKVFLYQDRYVLPCLSDYREEAGSVDAHYFYQDIYMAKKVHSYGIEHICDIGSRVDGYISHLLSMDIKVTMIDVRPLAEKIEGLDFVQGNACDLSGIEDESIEYMSCLHALEHFGLGRYGDEIDYLGYKKAIQSYKRVLKKGGLLFLSVPIGKEEMVMFNAHRIFSPTTIIYEFGGEMKIQEFTFIKNGEYKTFSFEKEIDSNNTLNIIRDVQNRYLGNYDCGLFILKKE